MKKKLIFLFLFFLFFFLFPKRILAQNKAGIHIGDHFSDFDKAARIVGNGGWVVIMACPGDGDKIQQIIIDHPDINIVLRGHYPGSSPDESLAKAWAATLGSLTTPNKIYFVPWNEPNQFGSNDWAEPSALVNYTNILIREFNSQGIRGSKIVLLSPMLNETFMVPPGNPLARGNFDSYVQTLRGIKNDFFSQFDGISMNLYQICYDASCQNDPHFNPLLAPNLLGLMGATGKEVYGIESGTAGEHFYFREDSQGYLADITRRLLNQGSEKMFAIPAYDLGSEVGQTYSLFESTNVVDILRNSPKGGLNPSSYNQSGFRTNVPLCPGKFNSYSPDLTYCTECGSLVAACKPLTTTEFGVEKSKETIDFKQEAKYVKSNGECLSATYNGTIKISDLEIPFVKNLNKFFLGPYVDSPLVLINKKDFDPFKDTGVLEKNLSPEKQDSLRLQFLSDISGNPQSRYVNFRINGKNPASLTAEFTGIREKIKRGLILTDSENTFINKIWPQVPLIANEETQGEIDFSGSGINSDVSKVKTSVPEVYRLNKATEMMAAIFGIKNGEVQGQATSKTGQVLPATACLETQRVDPDVSNKETKSGPGEAVCTKDSIQTSAKQLEGNRTFINDAGDSCAWQGGCDVNPDGSDVGNVRDRCCGNQGKCHIVPNPDGTVRGECDDGAANKCEGGYCWGGGIPFVAGCCVISDSEKTKTFDDTKLNSVNKVPFLNKIAENTVGVNGFFRVFFPAGSEKSQLKQQIFKEVAGESKAKVNIEIDPNITKNMRNFTVTPNNNPSTLSLLFHKLGTLINVKNFVSGKILWSSGIGSSSPETPGVLDYTIDFRNPNVVISDETKNRVIGLVKQSWPRSSIDTNFDMVASQAVAHGWNPAFVITLWIEESGASGVDAWDLGCLGGSKNNLQSQLDCLFNQTTAYSSGTFELFMCMYSEGVPAPCTFTTNPNFPGNIKSWYNLLKP